MVEPTRRPGPPSTLSGVREKLLDAATARLLQRGIEVGLGHITLAEVIKDASVPRSTAYRALSHPELDPQAVLRREVLRRLLARSTRAANRDKVSQVVLDLLEQNTDVLESGTVAQRTALLREAIRLGGAMSFNEVSASTERQILTSAYGAVISAGGPEWQRLELERGEHALSEMFAEIYDVLSDTFDYRLKPGITKGQFATAAASLVEGLAMRAELSNELGPIERSTGPDGAPQDWTLFAMTFESLYIGFWEPNAAEPFADLANH